MKQINPLYVAMLLVVALLLSIVQLNKAKEAQYAAKENLEKTMVTAERIVALQKAWANSEQSRKNLQRLLRAPQFKNSAIEENKQGEKTILSAKKMELAALNYLVNKLLNGTYVLNAMRVKEEEPGLYSLSVEINL